MAHTYLFFLFVSHSSQGETNTHLENKQSFQEINLDNSCLTDLAQDSVIPVEVANDARTTVEYTPVAALPPAPALMSESDLVRAQTTAPLSVTVLVEPTTSAPTSITPSLSSPISNSEALVSLGDANGKSSSNATAAKQEDKPARDKVTEGNETYPSSSHMCTYIHSVCFIVY